jgi:hypothetical protein
MRAEVEDERNEPETRPNDDYGLTQTHIRAEKESAIDTDTFISQVTHELETNDSVSCAISPVH